MTPGKYYIELKSLDDPLAVTAKEFSVYQKDAHAMPYKSMTWYQTDKTSLQPGDVFRSTIGSSAKNVRVWVQLLHGDKVRLEQWITLNNEVKTITYTVKEEDRGGLSIKTVFVKENTCNIQSQAISVPYDNLDVASATTDITSSAPLPILTTISPLSYSTTTCLPTSPFSRSIAPDTIGKAA